MRRKVIRYVLRVQFYGKWIVDGHNHRKWPEDLAGHQERGWAFRASSWVCQLPCWCCPFSATYPQHVFHLTFLNWSVMGLSLELYELRKHWENPEESCPAEWSQQPPSQPLNPPPLSERTPGGWKGEQLFLSSLCCWLPGQGLPTGCQWQGCSD